MRVFSTLRFVLKRSWHRRAILFPVVLATLGVVILLAGVPQFSEAATNIGLQATLHASGPAIERNLEVVNSRPPLTADAYQQLSDATTSSAHAHLGKLLPQQAPIRRGETAALTLFPPGTPADAPANRALNLANLWFVSGEDAAHLNLLAGQLPSGAVTRAQTMQGTAWDVEAMIAPDWATTFNLKLNDVLIAEEPGHASEEGFLRIHIVGFFQPRSLKDPIWFDDLDPFTPAISAANQPLAPIPIWINEAAFHQTMPKLGLQRNLTYTWMYYLDLNSIIPANVAQTANRIVSFKSVTDSQERGILPPHPSLGVLTELDALLQAFLAQLFFVTVVTLVTILPGIVLLLYYLGIAAAALTEHSREDLALMQSRGASRWQVLSLMLLEALLLSGTALLVAPWLSAQIIRFLAHQGYFSAASGQASAGSGIPSGQAYLYAGAGALICLLTMLLPTVAALRTSLVAVKRHHSRPRPRPLWQRVGPGFLLTALGVFSYLQIQQRGAFFTQNLRGNFTIDWVAALSPTLLLLGIAGLSSLLVPPLLLLGDWLFHRLPGVALSLAFRQMSRRPGPYIRLLLLLALTAALGVSASLFTGSLSDSFTDRAAYASGSDLRLVEGSAVLPDVDRQAAPLQDHLTLLPDVRNGMNGFRSDSSILPSESLHFPRTTVLGVDTARFAQLAYWRPDFASAPLPLLMQSLQRNATQEETLPAIIDDQLLSQAGLHLGSQIIVDLGGEIGVSFQVVGTFHYFPTLDTSRYALVCDMNRLITVLHQVLSPNIAPNEVWLKLAPNAPAYSAEQVEARMQTNSQHRQVVVTVLQAYDRQELAGLLRNAPLQRSISGALTLDFIIAALLSVIGVIVLFLLLAQQRAFEFGVLRAMGLSLRQLLWMLGCEQLTLLLLAGLLGIPLGLVVAGVTLPALSTDESGAPLLPPVADHFNTQLVIQQSLFLLACLLAAAAATTLIFRRLRLHATLQLGEE